MANENNQKQQELMFKLSMYEQQIQQLQQQSQAVEHAVIDMNLLSLGLEEMVGKTGKEILAPVGRGIFAKTQLLDEELIVDVGGKNFVTKSIPETKKIIDDQIKKLEDVKVDLNNSLEKVGEELMKVYQEGQATAQGNK
ncbi:MAG: prefoldin subunit alpha [archaeon]